MVASVSAFMLKSSVYPRVARETPSKGEVRSMEQGFLQIYTGKGKGKTTAALGLAIRAAGRGLRVYFGQFIKDYPYSEIQVLAERFPEVTVEQFGTGEGCLVDRDETAADREAATRGVAAVRQALEGGTYDVVIADEINVAHDLGLIADDDLRALIDARPANVELVLTGRGAADWVIEAADLVTEMTCVKHYYQQGVDARDGIER